MTQREEVAAIGVAIGRDIRVTELSRVDALARFSRFGPAETGKAVVRFLDDAAAGNSPATAAVEQILARPALTFAGWATDHAADFA
jgi:hypothetical protein